ncbi:MAG: AraC family transcriptional regulator ligand-binding domain-containing protein [Sphingorhabdus sp.]
MLPQIGGLEPDTVSANFIDRIIRSAVGRGASRLRILTALHLTNPTLRNPIGRLSYRVMIDLFAVLEREFNDSSIALQLGIAAKPSSFSDLGYYTSFSSTIETLLRSNVELQVLRQCVWRVDLNTNDDTASLHWKLFHADFSYFEASLEFAVAAYVRLIRDSSTSGTGSVIVGFQHRPRFPISHYTALLGCKVQFGIPQTRIEFSRNLLPQPLPDANPALQTEVLKRYRQAMIWLERGEEHSAFCYLYLASELNKSPLKLDRIATSFGLTERTLRRRLVNEGRPFRELLDHVRQDMCDLYRMENRRSMTDIAELLGYAELSAFTRAHKRWYGHPPSLTSPGKTDCSLRKA